MTDKCREAFEKRWNNIMHTPSLEEAVILDHKPPLGVTVKQLTHNINNLCRSDMQELGRAKVCAEPGDVIYLEQYLRDARSILFNLEQELRRNRDADDCPY